MTGLLLVAMLGAAPRVAVVVAASDVDASRLGQLQASVTDALRGADATVVPVSVPCGSDRACLSSQAKSLGLDGVVLLSAAMALKNVTVDLDGVSPTAAASLTTATFTWKRNQPLAQTADQVKRFVASFLDAVQSARPPLPAPEPVVLVPAPLPQPAPAVVVTAPTPAPQRSKVPAFVVGGVGVAAAVTSAVLLGLAGDARGALERIEPLQLTRAQAQQRVDAANGLYTGSLVAGLGALVAGVVAVLLGVAG